MPSVHLQLGAGAPPEAATASDAWWFWTPAATARGTFWPLKVGRGSAFLTDWLRPGDRTAGTVWTWDLATAHDDPGLRHLVAVDVAALGTHWCIRTVAVLGSHEGRENAYQSSWPWNTWHTAEVLLVGGSRDGPPTDAAMAEFVRRPPHEGWKLALARASLLLASDSGLRKVPELLTAAWARLDRSPSGQQPRAVHWTDPEAQIQLGEQPAVLLSEAQAEALQQWRTAREPPWHLMLMTSPHGGIDPLRLDIPGEPGHAGSSILLLRDTGAQCVGLLLPPPRSASGPTRLTFGITVGLQLVDIGHGEAVQHLGRR